MATIRDIQLNFFKEFNLLEEKLDEKFEKVFATFAKTILIVSEERATYIFILKLDVININKVNASLQTKLTEVSHQVIFHLPSKK